MDQGVVELPASFTRNMAESEYVLANGPSVEAEEEKKKHLPKASPSSQRTSQGSSNSASWKISKGPAAQGTAKNSTSTKVQASLSAKYVQTKKQSKQSLQTKTTHTQNLHSGSLEGEREDTSTIKDPTEGHEPRERRSTYHLSARGQRKAENTKSLLNVREAVAGQHQTRRPRGPGSSQKTIKASCEKDKETCGRLSAKESLASSGPDRKAEWNLVLEEGDSLTCGNSKYKLASASELTSDKEERRALCETAIILGQKRLCERTEMLNALNSTSLTDYNHLGFNLRSNIFQGGPLESRSLMKDSYTPDIIQKGIRDPKNWYGRKTDELGKWHQTNALHLNLQRALEDKYGKRNIKS
ncbi:PREDICTED: testis-expressed sequence 33 protein [Calidris pugnax]|uniref:testis-expressed sequence 33 protein n=1 Tax=Calidris pugnax TaxID=198806 RepID=UPI00071C4F76|nr:PREDICTED: testis-expressed sequence 33 protein [Calidris pugnax]